MNAPDPAEPDARPPLILAASNVRLPELLAHIEAGNTVLILPDPAPPEQP